MISIHALVKRATSSQKQYTVMLAISIHALVKRATCILATPDDARYISIHALVKRATVLYRSCRMGKWNFNPRPREEGDMP